MKLSDIMSIKGAMEHLRNALDEDIGNGDATTLALVDPDAVAEGAIIARQACRVAGIAVAKAALQQVDPKIICETIIPDGYDAGAGSILLTMRGAATSILTAERTALNYMQRMCGIATLTAQFVRAVQPHPTRILDTRKTTPGMRIFEKYAVLCGGGENHRFGLFDRVLIKDNHRRLWHAGDPDRLDLAVFAAREKYPDLAVEVEVESLAELRSALRAKPEWVLLDNMSIEMMTQCVKEAKGISLTEASGGITLERAAAIAATGVDAISLGCLTHSAPSIDLALEWETV